MTTPELFQEWLTKQHWIKWRDPKSLATAFILWGDYVKDKYAEYLNLKENKNNGTRNNL